MPEEKNMFDSLRLSAGGGLNSAMEKVAQADNAATIAIGIGGTGLSAVRMFKKTVYERVKQDNFDKRDTENPIYKRIRFLEIDSDKTDIESGLLQLDFSDEFFYIGVSDIIAELTDKTSLKNKKYLNWFNQDVKMTDATAGAGGIRQIGKYLLSKRANELYNKFKDMITTAVTGLNANFELNIYIMAGIGGGTGSGCFIDVCYIMQQALSDLGYQGSANILGFFFLPDVNLSNPHFPKGGPNEVLLKKNGYAAIKELDYLMNIELNGDEYIQNYTGSFEVHQNTPPVKMCHLLSTTAIDGHILNDGYNYIMNVVAEYALNFVVKAEEADQQGANSGISLKGIQANITALLQATHKTHGAGYIYNILGTSCAIVPYKKIGTYLAIRFFDSIKYIQKIRPNKSDVEKFCQNIGFNFNNLDVKVKANTRGLVLDANRFDTKVLKGAAVGTISGPLAEYCEKWKDDYEGKVAANIATLGRALDDYEVNNNPESIIGKIFRELISIVNNSDLGPYFAAYMINDAQNHTLSSVIAGIRTEVENKRNHAQGQSVYRDKCENDAQAEFRSATFDPFDKKKKNYVLMVELRYKNTVEINTYNAFLDLIDKIKKHVEKIEVEYFKKLTGIIDKLVRTFEDNEEFFNTHGMGNEMYTWSIIDINSIKSELDEVIMRSLKKSDDDILTAPLFVEKFNNHMLAHRDKWFDESETKIAELISAFIRDEFKDEMSKSMKQYLQEKYNKSGNDLIDCIASNVIKDGLVANGTPVFHCDSTVFNLADSHTHAEYVVLSIPNNEEDFAAAAVKYREDTGKPMGIAKNVLTDRIFMLEFFSGIPMYAYKDLPDYEKVYYNNPAPGMHMYESEDKNWRDLPSPIPATYESSFYRRVEQDKVDKTLNMFNEAVSKGFIKENATAKTAEIYITDNLNLDSVFEETLPDDLITVLNDISNLSDQKQRIAKVEECVKLHTWTATKEVTNKAKIKIKDYLNEYGTNLTLHKTILANQDFENSVRDEFARMPIVVNEVENELNKYSKLTIISEVLEYIFNAIDEAGSRQADFIRALMHSVIIKARSNYKYGFNKRGETEEIILTENNEKFESIPVYRAFISYQGLDDEIKEQIAEKTKSAAKNVTDEMYDNIKAYQEFYKENYKDYKKDAASGDFDNSEEIIAFLDELYDSIERFIRENK